MELVADGINAQVGGKAARLELLQVGMWIIAHLERRKPIVFNKIAYVVEVRWLVGGLPGGCQ